MIDFDICFCTYTGECPHRNNCRRHLTDADRSRMVPGQLITMGDLTHMRADNYKCYMPREENDVYAQKNKV